MTADTCRTSQFVLIGLLSLVAPAVAAVEPMADSLRVSNASGNLYRWQRIDLSSSELPRRNAPQIKVAIRTKGPSMRGLIRIPGSAAANFDTGRGLTVVDLINVGDEAKGDTEIVALEIVFTEAAPGQSYRVSVVDGAPS